MTTDHPTRAELAAELGYWPADIDPESVERHRRAAAADAASMPSTYASTGRPATAATSTGT